MSQAVGHIEILPDSAGVGVLRGGVADRSGDSRGKIYSEFSLSGGSNAKDTLWTSGFGQIPELFPLAAGVLALGRRAFIYTIIPKAILG